MSPVSCMASNLSRTRSRGGPSDPARSIIKRQREKISVTTGNRLTHSCRQTEAETVSPTFRHLSSAPQEGPGAFLISHGVCVHEPNERTEEEMEEEAGRGPSSPETNSMAGRVRVCKEGPTFSQRAEKMQRPVSQSKFRRRPRNRHDQREQ